MEHFYLIQATESRSMAMMILMTEIPQRHNAM